MTRVFSRSGEEFNISFSHLPIFQGIICLLIFWFCFSIPHIPGLSQSPSVSSLTTLPGVFSYFVVCFVEVCAQLLQKRSVGVKLVTPYVYRNVFVWLSHLIAGSAEYRIISSKSFSFIIFFTIITYKSLKQSISYSSVCKLPFFLP